MDLQDWELLSVDGLVDLYDDGGEGGDSRIRRQILPVAIQMESRREKEPDPDEETFKEVIKMVVDGCKENGKVEEPPPAMVEGTEEGQRLPQVVFFKKTTENEFADMKMDSPKFSPAGVKGFVPTIDAFFFDEQSEVKKKMDCGSNWKGEVKGGVNLWKWGMTGVGALCSFGIAAATVCVILLGSRHSAAKHNQNFRFQIYTDDKRIKQVVEHATKLNEAISSVRGVPMTGAHITFGGYYDGLI
jgi:hypothetical protein